MVDLGGFIPYTSITILQVLTAVIILVAGWLAAKIIVSAFKKCLMKSNLPELVAEFLARFFSVLLYVMVILSAVNAMGITVGSVVLGLSAVLGLILGFGMQDTLTNLFAGIWLAALRPIDKDEVVTTNGMTGSGQCDWDDGNRIFDMGQQTNNNPNKLVWGSVIENYTRMPRRRVDIAVGISYASDLKKVFRVAMNLMRGHSLVLDDPEPAVVATELADSSVNLQLRAWTKTANYWTVRGDLTTGILEAFRREGIEIPFPQLDVHLSKE